MLNLGLVDSFRTLPAEVAIGDRQYYLVGADDRYRLISRVCAHSGGIVIDEGTCFECPQHGWRYDRSTGIGTTAPATQLTNIPVHLKDGCLWVDMEESQLAPAPAGDGLRPAINVEIKLHSHACIEIISDGFSLLTDPWLNGPAMLGSWTQYPPPIITASDLKPDAILITHEHSDHFHEPTLDLLDRSIPIFVPDFPNQRMPKALDRLGFRNVIAMPFGKINELGSGITLTCFEPASFWNDCIVLMDINGFRILNLNDAGQNPRIANMIGTIDMLATGFSSTATGYPITWNHLSLEKKKQIIKVDRKACIKRVKERVKLYKPEFLLPFAAYFALWHPLHREYAKLAKNNSPIEISESLRESPVKVIDILPGESWDVSSGEIKRYWKNRKQLFRDAHKLRYIKDNYDETKFQIVHPPIRELTENEVEAYFLELNLVPDIVNCEDLRAVVVVKRLGIDDLRISFVIAQGRLEISDSEHDRADIRIEIPERIMASIVLDNTSWDEAHIGYWCQFDRDSANYHAGFWRVLQAPYFNRPADPPKRTWGRIEETTVIADLLEQHGPTADLYCAVMACSASGVFIRCKNLSNKGQELTAWKALW